MELTARRIPDFDFSDVLRVGTMLPKSGTTTKLPFPLPDLDVTDGAAWIVESGPGILRLREHSTYWGRVPVVWDTTVRRVDDASVAVSFTASMAGRLQLPKVETTYEVLDAGRGWLELRSTSTRTPTVGHLRVESGRYDIDLAGVGGFRDRKNLAIIQPGEPGYVTPPWLAAADEERTP